jgi:hypothetical protein
VIRRRELLAAAGVAVLARPAAAAAQGGEGDPSILARLIAAEEEAALAHRLGGSGHGADEREHAMALRTLLAAFGREAPEGPESAEDLAGAAGRLAAGRTPAAAVALEDELLATNAAALLEIREESVLRTAASILASHAQRKALLQ